MHSALLPWEMPREVAPLPDWGRQLEAWRRLLRACAQKSSRRRVHELRVATLRLKMQLEHWQDGHNPVEEAARAARRWNRQAERLRKLLGAVREADVFLGKLDRLRCAAEDDAMEPSCDHASLRQLDEMERRVKRIRQSAEAKLTAHLEERLAKLIRAGRDLEAALVPEGGEAESFSPEAVVSLFSALAAEFPDPDDVESLHDFRMRIKKARYLNDVFAPVHEVANRQAAALGRMQTALGEWHDWTLLAEKAPRMLRKRAGKGGLEKMLEDLAASSLRRGIATCRRLTARVLRHSAETESPIAAAVLPAKRPVRRAAPIPITRQEQSA